MKALRHLTLIAAILIVAGLASARPASAGVSFDFFYSNLSPHGSWQVSASFGRVWRPAVAGPGWNPYYDGHWAYTDVGWCWASDYAWGGIPYHYGTWVNDPYNGWVWVPGYTWAPAWVTFRQGPGYIGWAPVSPSFSFGVSFGFGGGGYYAPSNYVFVNSGNFLCNRVGGYVLPPSSTNVYINKTKIINNNYTISNNTVVNRGPSLSSVEMATHRQVAPMPIERVRGLSPVPGTGFNRDAVRLDPGAVRHGVRAAEPVSARTPLPMRAGAADRSGFSGRGQAPASDGRSTAAMTPGNDNVPHQHGLRAGGRAAAADGFGGASQRSSGFGGEARDSAAQAGSSQRSSGFGSDPRHRMPTSMASHEGLGAPRTHGSRTSDGLSADRIFGGSTSRARGARTPREQGIAPSEGRSGTGSRSSSNPMFGGGSSSQGRQDRRGELSRAGGHSGFSSPFGGSAAADRRAPRVAVSESRSSAHERSFAASSRAPRSQPSREARGASFGGGSSHGETSSHARNQAVRAPARSGKAPRLHH